MFIFLRNLRFYLVLLIGLFLCTSSFAQNANDALDLVKNVTYQVLETLKNDKEVHQGDARSAEKIIETQIAPHFDFTRMSALSVGRYWKQTNAEQKQNFAKAFKQLLIRTYANALTNYRDQKVVFSPMRETENSNDVMVKSQILQSGAAPIQLNYRLIYVNGEWEVVDIIVADASLVTTYRSNFSQEINEHGIDGLIKSLQEKNAS